MLAGVNLNVMALSGHSNCARVCPLLDKSGQRRILARDGLSANACVASTG